MFTRPTNPTTLVAEPNLHDVLWAEFVAPIFAGDQRFVRQLNVSNDIDVSIFDGIGTVALDFSGEAWGLRTIEGDRWTAVVATNRRGQSSVSIRAADLAAVKAGVALFAERIPTDETNVPDQVAVDFWHVSDDVYRRTRNLDASTWAQISNNYPDDVAATMGRLLTLDLDSANGKLVLWHGPPGTGKTTALRSLAREWRDQCRTQVLLDPERIFASSGNLFEVLIGYDNTDTDWRIIVIEDADELIRSDAKERVGQALARLLNLADGMLGQGLKVMTLITTNEPISRLHPALVRPGRCLAEIEFRTFTVEEARRRWPDREFRGTEVALAHALNGEVNRTGVDNYDPGSAYL